MTKTITDHIVKNWKKILSDYELVKKKEHPYFKTVKELCEFYDSSPKQLHKYRNKYLSSGYSEKSLLPNKRGPKTWSKRTPKYIERNIVNAYRKLGYNRYELVELFKPVYEHNTPASSTMYLIIKRYQKGLKKKEKEVIKRYEKSYPGELGHIDCHYLPKSVLKPLKLKRGYLCAFNDDCTRLIYVEFLNDIKSETVAGFTGRALSFFYTTYGIRFEKIISDNGSEFVGKEFQFLLNQLNITHIRTKPYRPQTNGKIEAFWKIIQREFLTPNYFENKNELVFNLGQYLYEFNNNRKHGGLEYKTPWQKYLVTHKIITELLN